MPKNNQIPDCFATWEDAMEAQHIDSLAKLARETGVDYKWLKDFWNDKKIALQTVNVAKINHRLMTFMTPRKLESKVSERRIDE